METTEEFIRKGDRPDNVSLYGKNQLVNQMSGQGWTVCVLNDQWLNTVQSVVNLLRRTGLRLTCSHSY